MKVAIVHDWMIHMRGGEKVLEAIAECYPQATFYTLFARPQRLSSVFKGRKIQTSFLQRFPGVCHYYRWLLPLMPWAIRSIKIERDVDLVVSTSHCVAKAIRVPPKAKHICYCHTPMRYLWGFENEYFGSYPFLIRNMIRFILSRMKNWDLETNEGVDYFICNSKNVQRRIERYYERKATVIYPPADLSHFEPGEGHKDYYLVVSAFVPYKKLDVVIEAFNVLDKELLVVGSGPMEKHYLQLRKSEKIRFLGSVSDEQLKKLYREAKALIFPTDEDFGIVPIEAQACGTPVIAYGRGGALESVQEGVFFQEQIPEALQMAILEFEAKEFDRAGLPDKVKSFDRECFKDKMLRFIEQALRESPKKDYVST